MADRFDMDDFSEFLAGDTSVDKPLREIIMESHQLIYHSEEKSRKDSADKKPKKEEP